MPYVYSTLSNAHSYAVYPKNPDPKQITPPDRVITINGGANVANHTSLVAPLGAVTTVSKEDLEVLKGIKPFQRHMKKGFIHIDERRNDPNKAAKDMTSKDKSAQLTESDFKQGKEPKINDGKPVERRQEP